VSHERSQAERELNVCFGTLAEATAALREGGYVFTKMSTI